MPPTQSHNIKDQFLSLKTAQDVALMLGLSYPQLSKIIYKTSPAFKYQTFELSKKSGGTREISAPRLRLKTIQRCLSKILYEVYSQKEPSHGFCKNRSIATNASQHLDKRFVFNIDLEDFFGSIHFGRVKNMFMGKPYHLPHAPATVIAQICCHNNKLPQGAPTSPVISNMIACQMDSELLRLAKRYQATYTRYADDITFSFTCSQPRLPKALLSIDNENITVGHELADVINKSGFKINQSKVRLCTPHKRLEVTGITVNEKANVRRNYIRQIRSMLYAWETYGVEAAEAHFHDKYNLKMRASDSRPDFVTVLQGKINYLKMVRGFHDPLYRKLAYKYSVCIQKPKGYLIKSPYEKVADALFIIKSIDGQGTGFLLDGYGLITCAHVVAGYSDGEDLSGIIEVFRHNDIDTKYDVTLHKVSVGKDIALLKFNDTEAEASLQRLKLGKFKKVDIGTRLTICGFPEYSEGNTPHYGHCIVNGKRIMFGINTYLVNTPVVHGNSGGPVINEKNEVIGIAVLGKPTFEEGCQTVFHGFTSIGYLLEN